MTNARKIAKQAPLFLILSLLLPLQAQGEDYALLVSGGVNPNMNYARYYRNLKKVHGALRDRGVARDHITTLYANGSVTTKNTVEDGNFFITTPSGLSDSLAGDGKSDISGPASKEAFFESLDSLSSKLKPGDHLFLFITDHGAKPFGAALWGGRFFDEAALQKALDKFPKGVKIHGLTTLCYGGRFTEITTGDRCFIANTDADNLAWSDATNDPYVDAFLEGWTGKKEKKSLLEAAEHAKSEDSGNKFQTHSLDFFVKKYQKVIARRKAESETCASCNEGRIETGAEISGQIAKALLINDAEDDTVKEFRKTELKERLKKLEKELASREHADLETKIAALQEKRSKITDAWVDLLPDARSAERPRYTRDIEKLDKEIREKNAKVLALRSSHSRALWELDFVQYATPEELKDYVELRKCMDYTF